MKSEQSILPDLQLLLSPKDKETDSNIICSLTDRKGTILYVNDKFCEISGYQKNELIGSNHNIINSGLHSKDFFKEMWRTVGNGNIWQGEIRNKTKNGDFYWVDTIIFPVHNSTLSTKQYFSVRTLINEKKKAELERTKRIEELQSLLFKVSHGLRQPITQLMGITELLGLASEEEITNLEEIVQFMNVSTKMLDSYTRELSQHIEHIAKHEQHIKNKEK